MNPNLISHYSLERAYVRGFARALTSITVFLALFAFGQRAGAVTQSVIRITSSANPCYGGSVTFTVTITNGSDATGTAILRDGTETLATGVTISGGHGVR